MPKRTKEEIAAEKEKEKLRALRRGPDLDGFLEGYDMGHNPPRTQHHITFFRFARKEGEDEHIY